MGYPPFALENPGWILSKFNGDTMVSLGDIVLPIKANLITLNMRSLVMDDFSPYKAILGRVWLYKMKVILSTYHQMVSYLTEARQVDLHGSQRVTRQCYQVAVESKCTDWNEDEPESSMKGA